MELKNNICDVNITIDSTYTVNSADNKYYDFVLNPAEYRRNDFSKTLSITIELVSKTFDIALIGSFYSYDFNCAVIEEELLTIMQNDTITQINILSGTIVFHKRFECVGCNFGLYKVKLGYVIHGEIEILMLNENFEVKWIFSGRDIFVSISDKIPFELCADSIKLYDYNDEYYEIDYNGNLIK